MPDLRRLKARDLEGVSGEWARPRRMARNQDTRVGFRKTRSSLRSEMRCPRLASVRPVGSIRVLVSIFQPHLHKEASFSEHFNFCPLSPFFENKVPQK